MKNAKKSQATASVYDDEFTGKEANSFSVVSVCADEALEDAPVVDRTLVTWFQVATNPPLSKELVDDLSHLVSDFLRANGFRKGRARVVQDPTIFIGNFTKWLKWMAVRAGETYEDRLRDYEE